MLPVAPVIFVPQCVNAECVTFGFDANFLRVEVPDAILQFEFFRAVVIDEMLVASANAERRWSG